MQRPKDSTQFKKIKPSACSTRSLAVQLSIAIVFITFLSACSNSNTGTVNENSSTIVVSPDSSDNNATNTPAGTDNTVLDDADTDTGQPLNTAENNTTSPSDSSGDNIIKYLRDDMPHDCLFDVALNNESFCVQPESRILRAWNSNGSYRWAFRLKGENESNEIHAIQVVNGKLFIVAEVKNNGVQSGVQTGFEVSAFSFGGTFVKTVALGKFQDYSFIAGHRIQVADIEDNLIIVGDYGLSSRNILPNEANGTFVAVFNTTSDDVEQARLYPNSWQTNPMQVRDNSIILELDHLVYEVPPDNLELPDATGQFQSIPFNRNNYVRKKSGLISFIEKPPLKELHKDMINAFSKALGKKQILEPDAVASDPVECSGGGSIQQNYVIDDFGSDVRTTTFDNCTTGTFSANGVLLQRQTRYCGDNCEGLTSTLRALTFNVTYTSGETWSVDGYTTVKETLTTISPVTGQIVEPETEYSNLTEINEFSVSSDQLTINLLQARYKYEGTVKKGTGTWSGSGTLSYASGVSETFSVDVSREILNAAQVNFSGQLEAKRSDGSELSVRADSADLTNVIYTTKSPTGELIQVVKPW